MTYIVLLSVRASAVSKMSSSTEWPTMHISQVISVTTKMINSKLTTILSSWKKSTDKSVFFFNGWNWLCGDTEGVLCQLAWCIALPVSRLRDTRICTKLTQFLAWLTWVVKSFRFRKHYSIGTISGKRNIQRSFFNSLVKFSETIDVRSLKKGFSKERTNHM